MSIIIIINPSKTTEVGLLSSIKEFNHTTADWPIFLSLLSKPGVLSGYLSFILWLFLGKILFNLHCYVHKHVA